MIVFAKYLSTIFKFKVVKGWAIFIKKAVGFLHEMFSRTFEDPSAQGYLNRSFLDTSSCGNFCSFLKEVPVISL